MSDGNVMEPSVRAGKAMTTVGARAGVRRDQLGEHRSIHRSFRSS